MGILLEPRLSNPVCQPLSCYPRRQYRHGQSCGHPLWLVSGIHSAWVDSDKEATTSLSLSLYIYIYTQVMLYTIISYHVNIALAAQRPHSARPSSAKRCHETSAPSNRSKRGTTELKRLRLGGTTCPTLLV